MKSMLTSFYVFALPPGCLILVITTRAHRYCSPGVLWHRTLCSVVNAAARNLAIIAAIFFFFFNLAASFPAAFVLKLNIALCASSAFLAASSAASRRRSNSSSSSLFSSAARSALVTNFHSTPFWKSHVSTFQT